MAEAKQVQLNGAYHGAPVPPPQNTYRSMGRRSSGCGPCCLLSTLVNFIVSIAIIIGIFLLVIWLLFRPSKIHVYVESATLTRFDLTNSNALNYNLTLDISIRNPNRRVGFYYDHVEARAIYDGGSRFGFDNTLPTFYQAHKNTTVLHPRFEGSAGALAAVASTFNREKGAGSFYVEVKIYASVRLKLKFVKIWHLKPKYDCVVKLPVPSNKTSSAGSFERTKCDVDLF